MLLEIILKIIIIPEAKILKLKKRPGLTIKLIETSWHFT